MSRSDEENDFQDLLDLEDTGFDYDTWRCALCHEDFVDPDDFPKAILVPDEQFEKHGVYWLSPTEVVCYTCASRAGIPSIEEEEDA